NRTTHEAEEVDHDRPDFRRPRDLNLGVAALEVGVRVMTRMAPAPPVSFANRHERRQVIEQVVGPAALERRAMREFVPARIARRIDGAVDEERGYGPPRAPRECRDNAGG